MNSAHLEDVLAELALEFGPDAIEQERVGAVRITSEGGDLTIALTITLNALAREICNNIGELPERDGKNRRELAAMSRQRVEAVKGVLPEALRTWFYQFILWNGHVTTLSDADFLVWLAREPGPLHLRLGIPAVQQRIKKIRWGQSVRRRRELAKILAKQAENRPSGKPPDDRILYHDVKRVEPGCDELAAFIGASASPRDALKFIEQHAPVELRSTVARWFDQADDPRRRRKISGYSLACAAVGEKRGLAPATVEKTVGRIRARRRSQVE